MSAVERTVGAMRNQLEPQAPYDRHVLDEPCPRCGSAAVRLVVTALWVEPEIDSSTDATAEPFPVDDPLFDCRECGFEWGELVRGLMS
jgi:predicted RNA-binding Zn-ribbon protein involved in translation (DUF1610 family)